MLVVFGAIEACSMIYMQQTVQTVAYETARFAVTPRSTSAAALSRGQQVLSDRGIQGAAIRLNPSDLTTADRGTNVVVNVSVPFGQNRVMRRYFFGDRQLEANVTMLRE
jgi:Flp pilus assembly protein TadG